LFGWKQYYTGIIHRHCDKMKSRILFEMTQHLLAYAAVRYGYRATRTGEDTTENDNFKK